MVNVNDIKIGDKVTLELEVMDNDKSGILKVQDPAFRDKASRHIFMSYVVGHKPTPREIKVGDIVCFCGNTHYRYQVKALFDDEIVIKSLNHNGSASIKKFFRENWSHVD